MHHHNHYYGQTHILSRYCGLDDEHPPRIRGYLQHGWNVGCGWNPVHEFFDGAWRYTWSDAPRRRGHSLGRRNYHVVGAPFLYLMELEPDLGAVPEAERSGTLWFLFHGWEGGGKGGKIQGDHARLISEIRETETEPVTISLYYTEFERPEVRRAYEKAGFEVICFGKRGWNYEGTDRRFLYKQLETFRRFKRVAANRLSTAVFFGVAAGCTPAVYGDPMALEGDNPLFGGQARIARLWPEMLGKEIDLEAARATTDVELGRPYLMPPAEMRMLLDWNARD
ncbi:hypothetical protein Ait01nite_063440 [Actinoplanes italicus]|uniref:Uncharacterized protein n=1 Tax=Actinoplanes italicus TaxID=113567 RepID=A0A2T0K4R9_9ACTN|nr:hypothetical protein [Actinoplanes italicus]PRX17920.1 hypothetical protein CLV67_11489 [Actinoplanes italicus]GIE33299.1 hypothetical protein Ait01nite_063440 [Actinoplanes italicus]